MSEFQLCKRRGVASNAGGGGRGGEPTRRALLKSLAGFGAGIFMPAAALPLTAANAGTERRIDVHRHFTPKAWLDFFAASGKPSGPSSVAPWTLSEDLEDMERGGIKTAILSIFTPYDVGTVDSRRSLAREINEAGARLVADHTGTYGQFATLPMPDVGGSLKELSYAFDTLKVDGITLYSNMGATWLGNSAYDPVFEELNRRKAVVFVHPCAAACCQGLLPGVPDSIIEFETDTARAIASLLFSSTTARFPDVRFIISHGGGTMPMLIERFLNGSSAEIVPGVTTKGQDTSTPAWIPPQGVLHELRKMHYDTAQCTNPLAMRALRTLVPVSQILFGTDHWYRTAAETVRGLTTSGVFNRHEMRAIDRTNAIKLFPRLDF